MGKKLYVGNLTFAVGDAELEDLFAPFGEVRSAQVVIDRQTGRSRGFGFVEMENDADAMAAVDALHDQDHGGRRLTVNEAKPRRTAAAAEGAEDTEAVAAEDTGAKVVAATGAAGGVAETDHFPFDPEGDLRVAIRAAMD